MLLLQYSTLHPPPPTLHNYPTHQRSHMPTSPSDVGIYYLPSTFIRVRSRRRGNLKFFNNQLHVACAEQTTNAGTCPRIQATWGLVACLARPFKTAQQLELLQPPAARRLRAIKMMQCRHEPTSPSNVSTCCLPSVRSRRRSNLNFINHPLHVARMRSKRCNVGTSPCLQVTLAHAHVSK
jgi:hypothetical protein